MHSRRGRGACGRGEAKWESSHVVFFASVGRWVFRSTNGRLTGCLVLSLRPTTLATSCRRRGILSVRSKATASVA